MHIEHKVGQMLMGGFHGLTAPDYFLEWLREGRLGGVILFARNVQDPVQLAALTRSLHAAAAHPLLIAIDQEGGTVTRMRHPFSESPGAMALASITHDREHHTQQASAVLGREMAAMGINWTFAPAVDISYNAANPTVGTRSFGRDPEDVAQMAAAAVRGFQSGGAAACAKHFPGLGDTATDTHLDLPRLSTAVEHLVAYDLLPYRAAVQAGVASIMTTHTIFEQLDTQHPATLSEPIISRLIRDELGFNGVVTTDCMEMKAVDRYYGVDQSAVMAANAGVDVILFSHTQHKQAAAYDALLAAVRDGRVSEATVDAAVRRISAMKARFAVGHIDPGAVGTAENRAVMQAAAQASIAQIKPPGSAWHLPDGGAGALLVSFNPAVDSLVQEDTPQAPLGRIARDHLPNLRTATLPARPTPAQMDALDLSGVMWLVLATRNAHLIPEQQAAVRRLAARAPHVALLALRNPYDAALLPDAAAILCSSGDSLPSLEAIAAALAGKHTPTGRPPVTLA